MGEVATALNYYFQERQNSEVVESALRVRKALSLNPVLRQTQFIVRILRFYFVFLNFVQTSKQTT